MWKSRAGRSLGIPVVMGRGGRMPFGSGLWGQRQGTSQEGQARPSIPGSSTIHCGHFHWGLSSQDEPHLCVIFDGALGAVCGSLTHTQPVTVLVCRLCFAFSPLPQRCSPSAESIPAALNSGYLLLGSRAGIINAKLIQAGAGPCFGETPQPENGPVIKAVTICLT